MDRLIDSIKERKCVLFIGPEIVRSYHNALTDTSSFKNSDDFEYIKNDELFLLSEPSSRVALVYEFKKYINRNSFLSEDYIKLAQIPFTTIIDATRYTFVQKLFKDNNYYFQSRFLLPKGNPPEKAIEEPTPHAPLIYNLFGSSSIDESLLLTHADLFDYLTKLLSPNALPDKLRSLVKSSAQVIFLGFKFEQWYLQLLLRVFEFSDKNVQYEKIATPDDQNRDIVNICKQDFKLKFITEDIASFINSLHNEYDGELRVPSTINAVKLLTDEFNDLIEANKFSEAIKKLKELEEKYQLQNLTTNLAGAYNIINDRRIAGSIATDDLNIQLAVLRQQFMAAFESHRSEIQSA